jgi:hypothetical protein
MNSIGKIAGKQGKGQTIFELRLMISDFAERRSLGSCPGCFSFKQCHILVDKS